MIDAVTIPRAWIALAEALADDAERGKFFMAILRYGIFDEDPPIDWTGKGFYFFEMIKKDIDKSCSRRRAQAIGVKKRLQNRLQNDLQTQLQTDLQNGLQTPLQTELQTQLQNKEKERKTPLIPPAPPIDSHKGKEREILSAPASAGTGICAMPTFWRQIPEELKTPEFIEKWSEWEKFRSAKRKPISYLAAARQLAALGRAGVSAAITAIDDAIRNDYQGLFPKNQKPNSTPAAAPVYTQNERGAK